MSKKSFVPFDFDTPSGFGINSSDYHRTLHDAAVCALKQIGRKRKVGIIDSGTYCGVTASILADVFAPKGKTVHTISGSFKFVHSAHKDLNLRDEAKKFIRGFGFSTAYSGTKADVIILEKDLQAALSAFPSDVPIYLFHHRGPSPSVDYLVENVEPWVERMAEYSHFIISDWDGNNGASRRFASMIQEKYPTISIRH